MAKQSVAEHSRSTESQSLSLELSTKLHSDYLRHLQGNEASQPIRPQRNQFEQISWLKSALFIVF